MTISIGFEPVFYATASKSMHPFSWNFVHKKSGHTDRHTHTHRHTHTQTGVKILPLYDFVDCNENFTILITKGNP